MTEIVIDAMTPATVGMQHEPATLGMQKREWGFLPALGGVGRIQRLPEGNKVCLQS